MDRSIAFYRDLLGLELQNDWVSEAGYLRVMIPYPGLRLRLAFFRLPGTEMRLELIQYLEPVGAPRELPTNVPGAAHVCFDVDDIEAEYERLRRHGVTFNSAPQLITSKANSGARGVYMLDPDGITIELRQPPPRQ